MELGKEIYTIMKSLNDVQRRAIMVLEFSLGKGLGWDERTENRCESLLAVLGREILEKLIY